MTQEVIPLPRKTNRFGAVAIAVILAIGICTALNVLVVAVIIDAFVSGENAGISENATQILTGWGGGILSVVGAVVGYQAGTYNKPVTETQEN